MFHIRISISEFPSLLIANQLSFETHFQIPFQFHVILMLPCVHSSKQILLKWILVIFSVFSSGEHLNLNEINGNVETEVQLQSISTVSNFMSSVKSAIVWKSWGNLVPPEMQILLDLVAQLLWWLLSSVTRDSEWKLSVNLCRKSHP